MFLLIYRSLSHVVANSKPNTWRYYLNQSSRYDCICTEIPTLSIFLPFLCLQLNAASLFHLFTHVHHIHARYNSLPLLTSGTFPEKTGAQYASQPLRQKKIKIAYKNS